MAEYPVLQAVLNKARKDKYLLVLDLPPVIRNLKTTSQFSSTLVNLNSLQFSVWGGLVPDISIPAHGLRVLGQTYNVTSQTREAFPPITVNFNVDNRFQNYFVLWKWLEILNDPVNSGMDDHFSQVKAAVTSQDPVGERASIIQNQLTHKKENRDTVDAHSLKKQQLIFADKFTDYQTNITVYGLDEYNKRVIQFDYSNCFITRLNGITYDYKDPDEVQSSFQFVFNQLKCQLLD